MTRRKPLAPFGATLLVKTERQVEAWCDDIVEKMSGKSGVVKFSQLERTKQTLGISDRRYRVIGGAFWFEVKSEEKDALLTREQSDFLEAELACGELAACGIGEDLQRVIDAIREEDRTGDPKAWAVCRQIVTEWQGRGFRGEQKPNSQRGRRT